MTASNPENCPDCGRPIPESAPQGLCPKCLLSEAATETVKMDGPLPDDPTLDEVKAAFPALEVLERVGAGGMGIVYKARQRRLDRLVALKLLRCLPEQEAHFAERFLREARALAKLNHPNIVTVFDFGESHGHYYLLMEYVDGVNLRQAMAGEQLTPDEALRIVPVVCGALQYAHEHGVLHRDIKPANILINRQGEVKMADFGLAKFTDKANPEDLLTRTEAALGTPAYMAPEQTTDPSRVDHRADIYSLGVVFYEMLTGDLPLGRFPAPSSKASVDQRVDDVVMRALEREPEERYQSAQDVRTDVEHLSTPGIPKSTVTQELSEDWMRLAVIGSVVVAIALVVLAGNPYPFFWAMFTPRLEERGALILMLAVAGTWLGFVAASKLRRRPEPAKRHQLVGLAILCLCWPVLILQSLISALMFAIHRGIPIWIVSLITLPLAISVGWRSFRDWMEHRLTRTGFRGRLTVVGLSYLVVLAAAWALRYGERSGSSETHADPAVTDEFVSERFVSERRITSSDTPLIIAAKNGYAEEIRDLIRQGADIEAVNDEGYTAFLAAARGLQLQSLRVLMEGNANLRAVHAATGNNALHLAVAATEPDKNLFAHTLIFLQDHGINAGSTNRKGQTPLMLAMEAENEDALSWLRGVQKVLGITDNEGRMALDYAAANGQTDLTARLAAMKPPETASWCLLQTFLYRSDTSGRLRDYLGYTLAALERYPVKTLAFGMGWDYTIPHPKIALQAMMVEAAASAGDDDMARQALGVCQELWPPDAESLVMIQRANRRGSALTIQTLSLDRDKLDQPLHHERHESALVGTTRTESNLGVAEQPLRSETFFK